MIAGARTDRALLATDAHRGRRRRRDGCVNRRACASLVAPFSARGVRCATLARVLPPARSSAPSLALRPRVAARSPMSGGSSPVRGGRVCVIDESARHWSRGSPRGGRELALRTDDAFPRRRAHRHLRCPASAPCGAFGDGRRVFAATRATSVLTSVRVPAASFAAGLPMWGVGGG
jgi:hypothetical protein